MDIVEHLKGWERVVEDYCKENYVTDIQTVNMPINYNEITERSRAMFKNLECDTFIYAAYLPPGLHQFVLYCPATHRAFCKDFIVDLSASDLYPEYPQIYSQNVRKKKVTICNMWRKWRYDSSQDEKEAFQLDVKNNLEFSSKIYFRSDKLFETCKDIMADNFKFITITFMELLTNSLETFPYITCEVFVNAIQAIQSESDKLFLKEFD